MPSADSDAPMLPAIETVESVIGIRNADGELEPIMQGRTYDTRITPLLSIRRTVLWAESVASEWEEAPRCTPPAEAAREERST